MKPRRFQFSLKRLFVIMALVAIAIAFWKLLFELISLVLVILVFSLILMGIPLAIITGAICAGRRLMRLVPANCSHCRDRVEDSGLPCPKCGL
jgi:ABC-type proline/glycine betaine transport system permease subunit